MRKKNPQTLIDIKNAVYDVTIEDGYQNLSMSKIAKRAGISQATIYLTYASKEEMLTQLFIEARTMLARATTVDLTTTDIEAECNQLFTHYLTTLLAHPKQALFLDIVNNAPSLIDEQTAQQMTASDADIDALFKLGQKKGLIADLPLPVISAFTFDSLNALLRQSYNEKRKLTKAEMHRAVSLCWKVLQA